MEIGLVVYGDLEQRSGGYRYDRRLVSVLEDRGDEVEVISIPRELEAEPGADSESEPESEFGTEPASETPAREPSIHDRLDRPYDVLLQDELCHPTLVDYNHRLERPETIVSLVHLLRAPDPSVADPAVRRRERRYLESVDAAVCTSAYTRDRVTDLVEDLPTQVAPPAGRWEGAAVSEATVRKRARTDPFRVTFVGNLIPRKNVTTLLEALARVDDSNREWHLTVVGNDEADPEYARMACKRATALGVDDRVTFTGEIGASALESVLERSHVLAVPSRYEGFGMVYLEAMEYGVVPIAGSVGGATDIVADGRNGFVVDPSDAGGIAARLESLATERDRLARRGVAALETAAAHPTWDETFGEFRAFLGRFSGGDSK